MADDGKEKKTVADRAGTVTSIIGKIVKAVKYLANPVIFWIAVGLLILLFIISLWGFIESMPGNALAQIRAFFTGKTNKYEVEPKEIKEMCEYIEKMGYDLEGYGFVETITRDGKPTDEKPKGEIEEVTSKYLEAYIIANKEMYNFAENDYERGLLVRDKSVGITGNGILEWISFWTDDTRVGIDVKDADERLIIKVKDGIFGEETNYGYDLNEWTCKYGKPSEFLIALHLATGAPDFVYKLATAPEVDTKAHMELYSTTASIELVDKNGTKYEDIFGDAEKKAVSDLQNSTNLANANKNIEKMNNEIKNLNDAIKDNGLSFGSEIEKIYPYNSILDFKYAIRELNGDYIKKLEELYSIKERSAEGANGLEDYFPTELANIRRYANEAYKCLEAFINEIKNKTVNIDLGNGTAVELRRK